MNGQLLSAVAAAVAVASLITIGADNASMHSAGGTTAAFSRLADIPSHSGVYRASLVRSSNGSARLDSPTWIVKVETTAGTPVNNATLALESWMPDDDRVPSRHPRVTRYLGDGRYEVDGLRLERHGWWNVKLQIVQPDKTDSLAFNLVR